MSDVDIKFSCDEDDEIPCPDTEEEIFDVVEIVKTRVINGEREYRLRWDNPDNFDDLTWEREVNLIDCDKLLQEFEARCKAGGTEGNGDYCEQRVKPEGSDEDGSDSEEQLDFVRNEGIVDDRRDYDADEEDENDNVDVGYNSDSNSDVNSTLNENENSVLEKEEIANSIENRSSSLSPLTLDTIKTECLSNGNEDSDSDTSNKTVIIFKPNQVDRDEFGDFVKIKMESESDEGQNQDESQLNPEVNVGSNVGNLNESERNQEEYYMQLEFVLGIYYHDVLPAMRTRKSVRENTLAFYDL